MLLNKQIFKGAVLLVRALLAPLCFALLFLSLFYLLPVSNKDYSFAIYDRNEKLLCASLSSSESYHIPLLQNVNPLYEIAVIVYEDRAFYLHFGFDISSIVRAGYLNIKNQRIVSGASTLTMQVARLLSASKERSYIQKLKELFYTLLLEAKYTKDEIFLLYASHAPLGGNVVGVESAAFRYYSTSQKELTASQVATLAALPNQPSLVTLVNRRERLKEKRDEILKNLYYYSILGKEDYELSIEEELSDVPRPLPFLAMHYHDRLKKQFEVNNSDVNDLENVTNSFPQKHVTSLDYTLQDAIEKLVEEKAISLRDSLVFNMAALVLEVETGDVLAYIGNSGFFAKNGKNIYVDMVAARRSSGSLLKPFLYAGMLDRGIIFPSSLLKDTPTQIRNYSPKNNNGKYTGMVVASEALARSLNVPFVRALREYGIPPFLKLLKECGFSTLDRTAEEYGLPLILGGGEVTLFETCNVYASFVRCAMGDEEGFPISRGAAYLTLDALTHEKMAYQDTSYMGSQKIAWKTGTSNGFKDAWSIGCTPKYVVGVWAGNADGVGRPEIRSNVAAVPLMFDIFDVLEKHVWLSEPKLELKMTKTCVHSGYPVSRYCDNTAMALSPIHAPSPKLCPYCQPICLSEDGEFRVAAEDVIGNERIENRFSLPPFEEFFYKQNHKQYRSLPPFLNKSHKTDDFDIIFPQPGDIIDIPIELSGEMGAFTAKVIHKNSGATLYWDIDGKYLGKTNNFHQFDIKADKGRHILTLTDNEGNIKNRVFFIK